MLYMQDYFALLLVSTFEPMDFLLDLLRSIPNRHYNSNNKTFRGKHASLYRIKPFHTSPCFKMAAVYCGLWEYFKSSSCVNNLTWTKNTRVKLFTQRQNANLVQFDGVLETLGDTAKLCRNLAGHHWIFCGTSFAPQCWICWRWLILDARNFSKLRTSAIQWDRIKLA